MALLCSAQIWIGKAGACPWLRTFPGARLTGSYSNSLLGTTARATREVGDAVLRQHRQQEPRYHREVIRDQQGVVPAHLSVYALESRAVEKVIHGPVRATDARVVGEVGQPLAAINTADFSVARDHRVLVPQAEIGRASCRERVS